jgi:hypothetical protein
MDAMAEIDEEPGVGEWLGFWIQIAVLALLAILGAWFASADAGPGDSTSGLILFACALLLAFQRVKARFDGDGEGWWQSLFVDTMGNLAIVVPLFVVIGLAGLFLAAAWGSGSLHDGGIGLFCASGLVVFMSLKRVFDRLDRHN